MTMPHSRIKKIKKNKKNHKNKYMEKKKKDKKKTLSLEEEYYGPLSKPKKKKSMYLLRCTVWINLVPSNSS